MTTQKQAGHTAGPWEVHESEHGLIVASVGHNPFHDGIIADLRTWKTPLGDTMPANARLIAAAPELLYALRIMINMVTDNRIHGKELDIACDVIAKATGQP